MKSIRSVTVLVIALALACSRGAGPGIGPVPTGPRLSTDPVTSAEQARAAERLAEAREAFGAGDIAGARVIAEEIVRDHPATTASVPALWLAAEAAMRLGDYEAAIAHAERYAGVFPSSSPEAEQAQAFVAQAREAIAARPAAVLGAILPQSGSTVLRQYADLILEGIVVAVDRYQSETGAAIELVVLDDGGDSERASEQMRELERRGAFGVVGPLLASGIVAAANARTNRDLPIVSPLEDMTAWQLPNVFSLGSRDTRGAEALAAYAVALGFRRVALLYPRMADFERQAAAFREALVRAGGSVAVDVPYDSGTTTFAQQLLQVSTAAPQALYVPAPERDVRQLAPQLIYYGLSGGNLQVLGGEAWANDELLRLMDVRDVEGVIAATPFYRDSDALEWSEFVERYETTHRRSLVNAVPALGYDAARLLLTALEGDPTPAAVSRRLGTIAGFRGATGVLSVRGGSVERMPFLVRIESRALVPISLSTGP